MSVKSIDCKKSGAALSRTLTFILEVRDPTKIFEDSSVWLLIRQREFYHRNDNDNSIFKASIHLSYLQLNPDHIRTTGEGCFSGGYYEVGYDGKASINLASDLTSHGGYVILSRSDLCSKGVGTYLMSKIVSWAKQWPEAIINPITLYENQAWKENKNRRNRFWERIGLVFDYTDSSHETGKSRPMPAKELVAVTIFRDNLHEHAIDSFALVQFEQNTRLQREMKLLKFNNDMLVSEIKLMESNLIRRALQKIFWCHVMPCFYASLVPGMLILVTVWLLRHE